MGKRFFKISLYARITKNKAVFKAENQLNDSNCL